MTLRLQVRLKLPNIPALSPMQTRAILLHEVSTEVGAILDERAILAYQEAPRGATGDLRSSIKARVTPGITARILVQGELLAEVPYAIYVAEGTLPGHWPPWGEGSSLRRWVEVVLGDVTKTFLIARAIFRRGTRAHFRFRAAFILDRAAAHRRVQAAVDRAAQRLGGR